MKWIGMLCALALLSGCDKSGPVIERSHVCAGWAPILISQADVLTELTAQMIEGHNEYGARLGCWKPEDR